MTEREPNNSFSNATSFTIGTAVTGNLSSITDIDYYSVNLVPGTISIDFDAPGNFSASVFNLDTRFLQGASLQTLANFHTGKDSSTTNSAQYVPNGDEFPPQGQTISTAAEYYFAVYHFDDGGSQTNYDGRTYSFTINQVTTAADTEAPRLQSVAVNTSSVITNKQVTISYGATDNQTGVDNVNFYWTDITGVNQRIARTSFATEDTSPTDGTHTFTVPDSVGPGQYFLSKIDLRDQTGNLIEYFRGGALDDNITDGDLPNHNLESSFLSGDFTLQGVSDLEAPRLAAFNVDTTVGQAANNQVGVSLSATDDSGSIPLITLSWTDITGINQRFAPIAFTGTREGAAQGNIHIDFTIPNSVEPGEYFLSRIDLTDGANNTISYFRGGALDDNISSGDLPNHTLEGSFTSIQSNVTVIASNTVPVANNDTATVVAGQRTTINIGANDSDENNDELTTTGLTSPSKGTVSYNNNTGSADTVSYTGFANSSGTDSFTYQVSDGNGGSDNATVTVTFQNSAPVANNDTATVVAGQRTTINIGANDTDANNDELTTTGLTSPSKGTVSYTNNTGSADTVTYTGFANSTGTDSFTYQVSDGKGGTDNATVTVTFQNAVPVANNDTATAHVGQSTTINIGANDSDPNNDELTTSGVSNPGKGSVTYTNNTGSPDTVTYTSLSTATGTDSFTYQVSDGKGGTDTATVTITLQNKPVANNDTASVRLGQSTVIAIGANDTDVNGDELTTVGLINPSKGTVSYTNNTGSADTVTYTPFSNASGTDSFVYRISDGNGGTDTATVSITFQNIAPVAGDDSATVIVGETTIINIGANDSDVNNDELTTSAVTNATKGIVDYINKVGEPDTVSYTPLINANGTDQFTYQVSDGKGGTDTATVTVTLETTQNAVWQGVTYSGSLIVGGTITTSASFTDINGNSDNVIFTGYNLVDASGFRTDADGEDVSASILITEDFVGKTLEVNKGFFDDTGVLELSPFYTIGVVTANTDIAGDISTTASLRVNSSVSSDHTNIDSSVDLFDFFSVSLVRNVPYTFDLEGSDTNAGTLILPFLELYDGSGNFITSDFAGGTGNNARITFTPQTTGTYFVASKGGESPSFQGTYTLSLAAANVAPVANNDTANVIGGRSNVIDIGANDTDGNNDELTTTGVTNPLKGNVVYNNNVNSADTVTYTPFANVSGSDSFTYQVSDGKGGTDTATVTVTLNTPPVASDDTASATAGQSVTINIGSNDRDADSGDRLTTSGFTNPTQGRVDYVNNVFSADQVIYTAFGSAIGTDSFTYQVDDGRGGTDTATVTVNLTALDVPGDRTTTETIQVGGFVTSEHTANDFADFYAFEAKAGKTYLARIEGASTNAGTMEDPLVAVYDQTGTELLLFDDDSGTGLNGLLTAEAYVSGTYYIASISGSTNNFSTGSYKLSVEEINTNPFAQDDVASVRPGESVRINIGLNDSDGNGDPLSSFGVTNPGQGSVVYTDNSFFDDFVTYTANANASGTDSFIYSVSDGQFGTDTATVTINISGVSSASLSGASIYRFLNADTGVHLYTSDEFEANVIIETMPNYSYEFSAFRSADPANGPVSEVVRYRNSDTGAHIFSSDPAEIAVLDAFPNYTFETLAYNAYVEEVAGSIPVYRFRNEDTGAHFYTANEAERTFLLDFPQYVPEGNNGVAYYVDPGDPVPAFFTPPEDQPFTLLGGILPDPSLIGGGDGGA
ncbi:Ig-like domain-containing protein [Alphaproteobacteria bacterium]|nr:Ig-like domain-containing protein [Alphaproteobacteria bacterium]